jgi:hypothetical protein
MAILRPVKKCGHWTFVLLAALSSSCGGAAPATGPAEPSSETTRRSESYDAVFADADAHLDTQVTFDAFVVGTAGGCLDVLCETESGCCGTCTGDAYFAATPDEANLDHAMFMSAAEGVVLGEGFGTCRDDDDCNIQCNPPAGAHVEVTGILHRVQGMLAVRVEQLRRL